MIPSLTAHLLQSTFFAAAAGLLTVAFRRNRAQVRYWLWLGASLKFVIPFAVLTSLGSYLETRMPAAHQIATQIATSYTLEQFTSPPFSQTASPATTTPATTHWIPLALFGLWLCGFLTLALVRFRSWLRVRNAVRAGTPSEIAATVEVRSSPAMLEPGVAGIVHPTILLPEGIADRLTPSELKAVLAHELCHVRRRDNLFAAIHMAVETVFWFHPLIWWIGAHLVEERERACDEEVLRQGNEPDTYADAILNVCKLYLESPLVCVSGISGAGIQRRIEAIMLNRRLPELNRAKKILLAGAGAGALAGPIVVGLLIGVGNVSEIHAQGPAPQVARTPKPQPAASRPKFEVASIRRCDSAAAARGGRGSSGGEGGGLGSAWSPGRITRTCVTAMTLIQDAYVRFADGKTEPTFAMRMPPISGAPGWVTSELYTVDAKAEGNSNKPTMFGPMLQSMLDDRFGLKLHYETRTAPTWELTLAKGGSKLRPTADEPGKCGLDLPPGRNPKGGDGMPLPGFTPDGHFHIPSPRPGQPCHMMLTLMHGRNRFLVGKAITLDELSAYLVRATDRPVADKTGLTGKFDVVLEFAPDETATEPSAVSPSSASSDIPTLVTALEEQLGLKLVAARGPREFIVIDHIARPSEN
ncbi:MAG TPA: M56 family metallopeptidase [Bryobacteraceae bacterium]|nr:M56 family metallopeptidase [Bryobacteraceae bacterium]